MFQKLRGIVVIQAELPIQFNDRVWKKTKQAKTSSQASVAKINFHWGQFFLLLCFHRLSDKRASSQRALFFWFHSSPPPPPPPPKNVFNHSLSINPPRFSRNWQVQVSYQNLLLFILMVGLVIYDWFGTHSRCLVWLRNASRQKSVTLPASSDNIFSDVG